MKNLQTNKGFTLVELLIVIAIALILVTVSVPIYGNLQVSAQLNENTSQMIQTVRIARVRSVARVNNASHGVYFEINPGADDRHILYQGDAYATRDMAYDRAVTLNPSLTLSTTLVGAEVNFSKGAGASTTTGTVTLTHDVTGSRVFTINAFGVVDES